MKYTYKKITDSDGITYTEVDYKTYLASGNKHRIVQSLGSRYYVEVNKDSPSVQIAKENKNG